MNHHCLVKITLVATALMMQSGLLPMNGLAQINLTTVQWNEDIDYLAKMIRSKHADFDHSISAEAFDSAIVLLKSKTGILSSMEIRLELEKIGAMIGDGHTWVSDRFANDTYHLYPIYLRWFDDGIYLVGAQKEFSDWNGSRLININGISSEEILPKMDAFIPKSENNYFVQYWEGYWLRNADALSYSGITTSKTANYTFQKENGDIRSVALSPKEAIESLNEIVWAYNPPPAFLMRYHDAVWFNRYDSRQTFYIKLNRYPSMKEMKSITSRMLDELKACDPEKIVIDFRTNGGGDKTIGEWLINKLINAGWINKATFFAITGDHTFSASLANALYMREKAHALIVGEPPTNRPNFFSENLFLKLPNSKINISIATYLNNYQDGNDDELILDHLIPRKFSDYQTGKDAVLDWIFEYGDHN